MMGIPNDYKSYLEKFVAEEYQKFYDEYEKPKPVRIGFDNSNRFQLKLSELITHLTKQNQSDEILFISNAQFLELMEINRRKAFSWRRTGKINFIQIGTKILYKVSDIQLLINKLS